MTTTTKIKRHFFYVETSRVYSKTYGGSNYTLNVYEILKNKQVVLIGERSACTRGHKGEQSEAWTVVVPKLTAKEKKEVMNAEGGLDYYNYTIGEKTGIVLSQF